MAEDEDYIIEEIPVFLAKTLEKNLYLLQFPGKSCDRSLDTENIVNSCIKPINGELKIDFQVETDSQFYDHFKGKNFAIASDGKMPNANPSSSKSERPTYPNGVVDKQTFLGTKVGEKIARNYCIGLLHEKEIHLTSLTDIIQMRPSFAHFDKDDKRKSAEQKAALAPDDEDEEEFHHVTVKFAKAGQNENIRKLMEKSYEHFIKKSAEEPWCELMWYKSNTREADKGRRKLLADRVDNVDNVLKMADSEYAAMLLPSDQYNRNSEPYLFSNIISKGKLKSMNIINQLKYILKAGRMLSFVDIMSILEQSDPDITVERVLRNLPSIGVLVRGNWIVQSEILYPEESVSKINGISAELMCRARDYVIYKFSRHENLHRRKVISATQLPPEEVTEILTSVARLNSEKKWELLLPPDVSFESRFPDLVERQEAVWNLMQDKYSGMDCEKSPKRTRKKSLRDIKVEVK